MFALSDHRKQEKTNSIVPISVQNIEDPPEIANIMTNNIPIATKYNLIPSESKLAMSRKKRISSIDTKDALSRDQYKLDNADFELGSAQFDMPVPNYQDKMSTISHHSPSPSLRKSPLKKKGSIEYPTSPNRLHDAGAFQKGNINEDQMDQQVGLFDNHNPGGGSIVLKILTKYVT